MLIFFACYVSVIAQAVPLYFCTAANEVYFNNLINLIGSIHKTNFDNLVEIAVYDLGLTEEQKNILSHIQKVTINTIEQTNPDILTWYEYAGRKCLGHYAWKPVVIKQALDKFPYVVWLDAGTVVLRSLDHLFAYIKENGYFLATIGDDPDEQGNCTHNVRWGMTEYVKNKFGMGSSEKQWILNKEILLGGVIGASRGAGYDTFFMQLYELAKDIRNYQDDGTTPFGYTGRHDQTLMSILAYGSGMKVHLQDRKQMVPMQLVVQGKEYPLYITWDYNYVNYNNHTHIYNCRHDLSLFNEHVQYLHWIDNGYAAR